MAYFTFLFLTVLLYFMTPASAVALRATTLTPSKFGLCGAISKQTCIGYKFGQSCSAFNICGPRANPFFSGKGCQPQYGLCGPASSTSTKKPPSTSPTRTASSTSFTRTTSSTPSVAASGSAIPTSTYGGGIAALPAGTAVAIRNPSFESAQAGAAKRSRLQGRQSNGQVAASTTGWTIALCNGPAGSCFFENYDAADGIWAFSAVNGGSIYQSDILLTIGASYVFTWYWKTVVPSGQTTIQGVFLGNSGDTDPSSGYTVGTPAFGLVANGQWAEQSISLGQLTCDVVSQYGVDNGNGTATFRMFIDGRACPPGTPCYNSATPSPSYTYYVDEIRVQATAAAASATTC